MDKLEFNNENPRLGIKDFSPSEKLDIGGQQTAVNWILIELQNKFPKEIGNAYEANQFLFEYLFEKAKAMEQEQLKKCYEHAMLALLDTGHGDMFEEYYNKTFKNKIWHNKRQ